jgi:REP element-mobilizing transposase RayT
VGHPLRMYGSAKCWFVTTRCFQARKLMSPHTPLVREVCGGVLAAAAERYGVKIYAYVFMSNHLHLVIGAEGNVVADFTKYLLGNLSRKLAPLCKRPWTGRFWERRSSTAAILDDDALEDRVKYVVSHGVKEGLVRHAHEWEGLHCVDQLSDGKPRKYKWFNWTARWAAKNRNGFEEGKVAGRYEKEWASTVELHLTPMPRHKKLSPSERRKWVEGVLRAEEAKRARRPVMGMPAVKRESMSAPRWRKRGTRPMCHSSSKELYGAWCRAYREFCSVFRFASALWLAGHVSANFPFGCFKPHVSHALEIIDVQVE